MRKCDIVIPVYNAYDCLSSCIDSILKNTDFQSTHLILIDDLSPDKRVLPLLKKYQKENPSKITVLQNTKNLGFVKTSNKGMKRSKNDILLLNSDTIVTRNWLKKMQACAYSDKTIATVTPFSNNLTPMTPLPESFRKQGFPDGWTLEEMAKTVEECSLRLYPAIPSAHGFCMYIKREAIDKIGFFDEKTFGKGYGEENDFCFRCSLCGYKHAFCDDTYIYHKGTQSFLDKRKFHNDELTLKYPKIMEEVGQWYARQELKPITDNILSAINKKQSSKRTSTERIRSKLRFSLFKK